MKREELFEALGELDDDVIGQTGQVCRPVSKRRYYPVWGAAAACLALAVLGTALLPPRSPAPAESETAMVELETRALDIYYLAEDGSMACQSMVLRCTAGDIFDAWAALNDVADAAYVRCELDNHGTETRHDGVVEYTPGDYTTLTLTVSAAFAPYAEGERGELLIQSLRETFYSYLSIDEFYLVIDA